MKRAVAIAALLAVAGVQAPAQEGEASVTLHSTVSGDREQPRVMYIVPWQQPTAAEFDYELRNTIAEDLFSPIDRDEFVRGLVFRHSLDHPHSAGARPAAETKN